MKMTTKKVYLIAICLYLMAISFEGVAATTIEEGMQELAQKIVANSISQNKRSIAISSFPHTNGEISELSNYLADELVLKLFGIPDSRIEIIERSQLNKIFMEMNLSMTGVVDIKTVQQIGQVHGVDALVLGSITEMGESIRINARLTDTETGKVFSAAGTTIPKTATIKKLLQRILAVADGGTETTSEERDAIITPAPVTSTTLSIIDGSSPGGNAGSRSIWKQSRDKDKKKDIYELDLSTYEIGDMPKELGWGTVVKGRLERRQVGTELNLKLPVRLRGDFWMSFFPGQNIRKFTLSSRNQKNIIYVKLEKDRRYTNVTINDHTLGIHNFTHGGTIFLEAKRGVLKLFHVYGDNSSRYVGSIILDTSAGYENLLIDYASHINNVSFGPK